MTASALIVASGSPRRRELLERVGLEVTVVPADVDESVVAGETPERCAVRLAVAKASRVAAARSNDWVLAADTVVALGQRILGKPADPAEAAAMLRELAGVEHQVTTGICVIDPDRTRRTLAVTTAVSMRAIDATDVAGYVASGEWRGKAGGYAIQGIGAALVREVRGSVTNVIGLPLVEVLELLAEAGAPRADLARGLPQ